MSTRAANLLNPGHRGNCAGKFRHADRVNPMGERRRDAVVLVVGDERDSLAILQSLSKALTVGIDSYYSEASSRQYGY